MGIRDACVRLLPLRPVATATVASISRNWVSRLEHLPFSVLSSRMYICWKKKRIVCGAWLVLGDKCHMKQRESWMDEGQRMDADYSL